MSTQPGGPPPGHRPRSQLEALMSVHRISKHELKHASGLAEHTVEDLRAGRIANKRLSTLARCAASMGLAIVEVFPIVAKSPRKPGLIAMALRRSERERRGRKPTR